MAAPIMDLVQNKNLKNLAQLIVGLAATGLSMTQTNKVPAFEAGLLRRHL